MTIRTSLNRVIDQFAWARVLVVGDVICDEWLTGTSTKVAREAPVPTVEVRLHDMVPCGAGNTAVNVAALGGRASILTALGDDEAGNTVSAQMRRRGVRVCALDVPRRRSVVKRRIVAGRQVVARFDEGDREPFPAATDEALARRLTAMAGDADVVVVADYGLGTCTGPALRAAITEVARQRRVLVDAHDVRAWSDIHPALVTPDWEEVAQILGIPVGVTGPARRTALENARRQLLHATGSDAVVATLDGDGAAVLTSGALLHVPTRRVDDPHSAGAGDTFTAALGLGLAARAELPAAVEIAVAAATVVVQRPGTATCSAQDLVNSADSALLPAQRLIDLCREHRLAGRRIAFASGCFDVLHAGHVAFLQAAAREADVLVVALNSDAGVQAIKGRGRPVNTVVDRASMVAAMDGVDHLVSFDGTAPLALIEAIRPDVYVKGADHDVMALPEARATASFGGRVVVVPLLPDRSTSSVIQACAAAQRTSA